MYRLILIASVFPIIVVMIARWWFAMRVLGSVGRRGCHCDLKSWLPDPDDKAVVHRSGESASEFGRELRRKALKTWRGNDPKAAVARDKARRFGTAVPPLSALVAAFALLVGKLPVMGVFAVLFAATALAAVMSLLTLPAELRAISREATRVRGEGSFPNSDDEDAVISCAIAHAWDATPPPILRWLQG